MLRRIFYWFTNVYEKEVHEQWAYIAVDLWQTLTLMHREFMDEDNSHGFWTQLKYMHRRVRLPLTDLLDYTKWNEKKKH